MLNSTTATDAGHSSNLLFMRRRQAADLILSLAEGPIKSLPARNLLLDALYQLPTETFIADDWHVILKQITQLLLQQETTNGARMPNQLSSLLSNISIRLMDPKH